MQHRIDEMTNCGLSFWIIVVFLTIVAQRVGGTRVGRMIDEEGDIEKLLQTNFAL